MNYSQLLYRILTVCSAFVFFFLFIVNEFIESHIYIYMLIISSIIYKFMYILYNDNKPLLVDIINKVDYICIINLLWKHNYKYFLYNGLDNYIYNVIILLSFINCYAFHFCIFLLYIITFIDLFNQDIILSLFYLLSGFFITHSYYSFKKQGWNIINSWNWHTSICICFLCVKISYMKRIEYET